MRNLVKIVMMIMLTAGLSSCEKIKSIFDVEFDTTLSGDLDIDITEDALKSTNDYEFHTSVDVNPLDDADIKEYIDNIKDFDVNKVVAEVLHVNKGNVIFREGTSFSVYDASTTVTWTLGGDWEIVEGTEITLDDVSKVYENVADILKKKGTFKVGADGFSSETDVSITIRLGIDTKVTANPL